MVIIIAMFSNIVHITPVFGSPFKSDFHGTIHDMVLQTAYKTIGTLVWSYGNYVFPIHFVDYVVKQTNNVHFKKKLFVI